MSKAKKAKPVVKPISPPAISWRAVPPDLGGGRAVFHDAEQGLPELLVTPKKGARWVLVHFPSRRHVVVKTKPAGLAVLKEIHAGADKLGLLPPVEKNQKKGNPAKKVSKGRARAGAGASTKNENWKRV